jgi:hypothetical protein
MPVQWKFEENKNGGKILFDVRNKNMDKKHFK